MYLKGVLVLIAAYAAFTKIRVQFYNDYYEVELYEEYDFIVVGAGTSGSVVASRLSESDNATVLVVEAGESGRGDADIEVPYFAKNLIQSKYDWQYKSVPQSHAHNREQPYNRGKVAGGSSAINWMVYTRGSTHDFDDWEREGAAGWSFKDVEPYFHKAEKAPSPDLSDRLGKDGKIGLGRVDIVEPLYNLLTTAFSDMGYVVIDYLKDGGIREGISKITMSILNGTRSYAADSYLWPVYEERKDRLHFSFDSYVHKVLIETTGEGKRAHGVRFKRNGVIREIRARKEVIVSAGALSSPHILLLSGIGAREQLEKFNITVHADLPGVGQNYEDHIGFPSHYYGSKLPRNFYVSGREVNNTFSEYLVSKTGFMTCNHAHQVSVAHLKSITMKEKIRLPSAPQIQLFFSGVTDAPDSPWTKTSIKSIRAIKRAQNGTFNHFAIFAIVLRPNGRGTISLQSSDPEVPILLDPKMLENEDDVNVMMEAARVMEKMEQTPIFRKYDINRVVDPVCGEIGSPVPRSDEYYKCHLREQVAVFVHASCTSKMGRASDPMAVLDPRLRVYGVKNLRVADASVMPHIVSANTQAVCYMIGEKAADMIKEEWGI